MQSAPLHPGPSCSWRAKASEASSSSVSSHHRPSPFTATRLRGTRIRGGPCGLFLEGVTSAWALQTLSISQRHSAIQVSATPSSTVELPLTVANVESVLDEVRPYLIADGGNVALHEIDGNVVRLKLQGACGSCPSSIMTMKMGIECRLMEKIPEIVAVEPVTDTETGLELIEENIEKTISHWNWWWGAQASRHRGLGCEGSTLGSGSRSYDGSCGFDTEVKRKDPSHCSSADIAGLERSCL